MSMTAVVVGAVAAAIVGILLVLLAVGEWRFRHERARRRGGLLELDTRAARDAIGRRPW